MRKEIIRTVLVSALLSAFAVSHADEEMQTYLQKTQELASDGKQQEALERFIWFHEHSVEKDPSMYGVRLSFALAYWKKLGASYPPALVAMKKMRDDKTLLLSDDKIALWRDANGQRELFHDVAALNRTLDEEAKTVELFRKLDQERKDLAKQCWRVAKDAVIQAKAYDLAGKYMNDVLSEFAKVKGGYEKNCALYGGKNFGPPFKSYNEGHFVEDSLQLIEVAQASGNEKDAKEIQARALAVLDHDKLRAAVK